MITKKKLLSTLVFAVFLTGSTIIYYKLGRLVAIGVALEVLSIYLLIKLENNSSNENDNHDDENEKK